MVWSDGASRAARLLLSGAMLAAGAACATRGDVEELMIEHQELRQRQDDLRAQLDQLQRNMTQLLQQMRADFQADLGYVREGMAAVEAALRGTESRIDQMRRFQPTPEPVVPAPVTPGDTMGGVMPAVDQVALYNGAITDYQQGRLDLARQGFQEYLRLFPQGLSAPDAQYWLGIIVYDQGDYEGAVATLREIPRRWPDSSKAPLSLRKIGDAYRALGQEDRARAAYEALIDRYPNSAEAEAARREIGD